MIEIKMHDGPGRLGKFNETDTPAMIQLSNSLKILKDEAMPYNVPKELALWSVENTIKYAKESDRNGIAVVHGSKYADLRVQCAIELEKLGNTILMIANPEELMKRPMDLVEIIVDMRKNINPNTAIYYPFAEPAYIPLLTYMGVDFFDLTAGDYFASLNIMLTSSRKYDLNEYRLYEMTKDELKEYNRKIMEFTLREVQEHMKNGTLRNLVEERCCCSPETMTALRILDRDNSKFENKHTQLY